MAGATHVPSAEIIGSILYLPLGLIARIDLGVYDMCVGQGDGEEIVDVGGKRLEARLVSHEAMDVDEQQLPTPSPITTIFGRKRLRRRRARVSGVGMV